MSDSDESDTTNRGGVYFIYINHMNTPNTWQPDGIWQSLEYACLAHKENGFRSNIRTNDSGPILNMRYEKRESNIVGNNEVLETGELTQRDMRALSRNNSC